MLAKRLVTESIYNWTQEAWHDVDAEEHDVSYIWREYDNQDELHTGRNVGEQAH